MRLRIVPAELIPWIAIAISLFSLGFTIYVGINARIHDRLSVIPFIHIARFGQHQNVFGIEISNNGIGPAVITSTEVSFDDKPVHLSDLTTTLRHLPNISSGVITYTEVGYPYFLSATKSLSLIQGASFNEQDQSAVWKAISERMQIRMKYCSVYRECAVACMFVKAGCQRTLVHH